MNLTIENSVHFYNTDGEKGDDGADGCAGVFCGAHDGAAAQSGKDGRTLNVTLNVIRNHVRVQANDCIDTFPLSDRAISIAMQSRGGDGGNGGKGFAGSVGTDYSPSTKTTTEISATSLQKTDVTCYLEYITTIYFFVCRDILESS